MAIFNLICPLSIHIRTHLFRWCKRDSLTHSPEPDPVNVVQNDVALRNRFELLRVFVSAVGGSYVKVVDCSPVVISLYMLLVGVVEMIVRDGKSVS